MTLIAPSRVTRYQGLEKRPRRRVLCRQCSVILDDDFCFELLIVLQFFAASLFFFFLRFTACSETVGGFLLHFQGQRCLWRGLPCTHVRQKEEARKLSGRGRPGGPQAVPRIDQNGILVSTVAHTRQNTTKNKRFRWVRRSTACCWGLQSDQRPALTPVLYSHDRRRYTDRCAPASPARHRCVPGRRG